MTQTSAESGLPSRLHDRLDSTRSLIPAENLYELTFEQLTDHPLAHMEKIYDYLRLGDFSQAAPHIQSFLDSITDYKTNVYEPDQRLNDLVAHHWGHVAKRYGYS